jgi:hypothetical protein
MIPILVANTVMVLLVAGIAAGILPAKIFIGAITVLHKTVGISLPTPDKERVVAVIWLAAALLIGDGVLFLLFVLAHSVGGG